MSSLLFKKIEENNYEGVLEALETESLRTRSEKKTKQKQGLSPLHAAILFHTNLDIVKLLVEKGADINEKSGYSPLHYAMEGYSSDDISAFLILKGADVNIKMNYTPFHFACIHQASPKIIKLFIEAGAEINLPANNTPLHYACIYKSGFEVVKLLIENGANIHAKTKLTPLHCACQYKNDPKIVHLLIELGADFLARTKGLLPINLTTNPEIHKLFLQQKCILEEMKNLFEQQELTDLTIQCSDGKIGIIQCLIQKKIGGVQELFRIINFFKFKKVELAKIFFSFLYSGIIEEKNRGILKEQVKELGLAKDWIKRNKGRNGVIPNLQELYFEDETKDFVIVVEEKKFKVHKFILFARTGLFRGMFLSVDDKSNSVSDYLGSSSDAISSFLKFLYFDKLDESLSSEIINELENFIEYYQMNENSLLFDNLKKLKK
ncbi:cyclin-dependent kinase inhibitor 2c [Anaeramoeba ignava]|uniref:Cyclin-dependent kinase inhibitor 2c n=1 Tax=Anaeramoeba ignava TaxID=1746090 RepID=A0A9Q0LS79_ANAIG|nr:cyclin-dependent kinase inhibitor 2c [Anaeramoeba ignava]